MLGTDIGIEVQIGVCVLVIAYNWSGVVGKSMRHMWLRSDVRERILALTVIVILFYTSVSDTSHAIHRDALIHGYRMIDLSKNAPYPLFESEN